VGGWRVPAVRMYVGIGVWLVVGSKNNRFLQL
jgi:hypothetical protein